MRKVCMISLVFAVLGAIAVAADGSIPNRLPDAKVGEWVLLQDVSGHGAGEKTRISVVEKTDEYVKIKREHYDADGAVDMVKEHEIPLERYAKRLADLEDKAKQIGRERLFVKDREITVQAVSWDGEDPDDKEARREFKIWVSDELPIGGIAKSWSSDPDFPAIEVIDFGF